MTRSKKTKIKLKSAYDTMSSVSRALRLCKGLVFFAILFITSFLGSVYILVPMLPAVVWLPKFWRHTADRLIGFWLTLPVALLHFMYGTKVFVTGDPIDPHRPSILIMNHRTRLDWMFLWSALYAMDARLLTTEKISLKRELKRVPGAGWAMECDGFIFLQRNWEQDQEILNEAVNYYSKHGRPYQILLFPEGTDKCTNATNRSHKFAKDRNLQLYDYVLHPRTQGFVHLVKLMKERNYLCNVYDVTVAYSNVPVQTEMELFLNGPPGEVHCHINAHPAEGLPDEDAAVDNLASPVSNRDTATGAAGDGYGKTALARWLIEIWRQKEDKLRQFYVSDESSRRFNVENEHQFSWTGNHTGYRHSALFFSLCFWITTTIAWTYFFIFLASMRIFFMCSVLIFVSIGYRYGGVERFCSKMAIAD